MRTNTSLEFSTMLLTETAEMKTLPIVPFEEKIATKEAENVTETPHSQSPSIQKNVDSEDKKEHLNPDDDSDVDSELGMEVDLNLDIDYSSDCEPEVKKDKNAIRETPIRKMRNFECALRRCRRRNLFKDEDEFDY